MRQGHCEAPEAIPQRIHQSWPTHRVPSALQPLSARWKSALSCAPLWQHTLWTDDANRKLWQRYHPDLLPMYDGYTYPVQRADATRLLYMAVHGGVYADMDTCPCDGACDVLHQRGLPAHDPGWSLMLVREPTRSNQTRVQHNAVISNFFMASSPNHSFWWHALGLLSSRRNLPVLSSTGPYFLNAAWMSYTRRSEHACDVQHAPVIQE